MNFNEIDLLEDIEEEQHDAGIVPYDPLHHYLMEIRKFPLLTREEEIKLAIRYKEKGDLEAAYKLVTSNLRLVVKIALEFHRQWMMNLLDLIQEGNIGLMQAVKKFDPYRGVKFSYYASYWIKAYILKFIMDNWKLVKIGTTQTQRKLFYNLKKEKEKLERMGFSAGPKLLAERFDTTEDEIVEMEKRLGEVELSLDQPVGDGRRETARDFISLDEEFLDKKLADTQLKELLKEKLNEFQKTLEGKEKDIFEKRIMAEEPLTLEEIGKKYGITKERIRQIEEKLKSKIKEYLKKEIPDLVTQTDNAKSLTKAK